MNFRLDIFQDSVAVRDFKNGILHTNNRSNKGGFSMPQTGTPRQGELPPAAKAVIALMRKAGLKVETDTAKMREALSRAMQFAIRAWHGTPHDFKKFLLSGIGTGEGAQVHGYGLYFAGEVIDTDAVTGGFNLQIAWSTGYLAGSSV